MDVVMESGRNPMNKHQIQPECARGGTVDSVLRDTILRRKRGQSFLFPLLVDHEQSWQPYPVHEQGWQP